MNNDELARTVGDLVTRFMVGGATDAAEEAGRQLYAVVSRQLRRAGQGNLLDAYDANTGSRRNREELTKAVATQLSENEQFRTLVTSITDPVVNHSSSTRTTINTQSGAGRDDSSIRTTVTASGGSAAGRDINQNRTKKTSYGGLVVAGVAVAVVLIVVLLGRAAYVIVTNLGGGGNSLNEASTCADFLASSDDAAKAEVMKELFLDRNMPDRAADPFIVQNTEYFCSQRPVISLAEAADAFR